MPIWHSCSLGAQITPLPAHVNIGTLTAKTSPETGSYPGLRARHIFPTTMNEFLRSAGRLLAYTLSSLCVMMRSQHKNMK